MSGRVTVSPVTRLDHGARHTDADLVAVEAPLAIEVRRPDGTSVSLGLLMRTPGDDVDLVTGWLVGEHIVRHADDLVDVTVDAGGEAPVARVTLAAGLDVEARLAPRAGTITSACGMCGRVQLLAAERGRHDRQPSRLAASMLAALPDQLRTGQTVFDQTGGLHAAAVFAPNGHRRLLCEDVGRHNAVDKVVGAAWRAGLLPGTDLVLAVSGRVAYEIVQKSAAAGLGAIVAVGAPSSLAVEAARAAGVILVGFARDGRANIYAGDARVS